MKNQKTLKPNYIYMFAKSRDALIQGIDKSITIKEVRLKDTRISIRLTLYNI
jgi:hypothetical protein